MSKVVPNEIHFKSSVTKSEVLEQFFNLIHESSEWLFSSDDPREMKANLAFIEGAYNIAWSLIDSMTNDNFTISENGISIGNSYTWGGNYERT